MSECLWTAVENSPKVLYMSSDYATQFQPFLRFHNDREAMYRSFSRSWGFRMPQCLSSEVAAAYEVYKDRAAMYHASSRSWCFIIAELWSTVVPTAPDVS
jgi:hypothetical protein